MEGVREGQIIGKVLFLHDLAEVLGVEPSYFIDKNTGFLKSSFKGLVELRCSEIGIYSMTELAQRLGITESLGSRLTAYDRQAKKRHAELARAKTDRENKRESRESDLARD